jgi:hypothetical protein
VIAIIKKPFIAQVTIILVVTFLIPSLANAQTTSHYGAKTGDSGANLVGFGLTMYKPINQEVYTNVLPLFFNIDWLVGVYPFFNFTFAGIYTYTIDKMSPIIIESNQTSNDKYDAKTNFTYNPSFSYFLNVSNLSKGQHSIVISAGFYYRSQSGSLQECFLNETSSPINFQIQNSIPVSPSTTSPTPTSSFPEFSWLTILPLFLSILSIVVLIGKRKFLYQNDH